MTLCVSRIYHGALVVTLHKRPVDKLGGRMKKTLAVLGILLLVAAPVLSIAKSGCCSRHGARWDDGKEWCPLGQSCLPCAYIRDGFPCFRVNRRV